MNNSTRGGVGLTRLKFGIYSGLAIIAVALLAQMGVNSRDTHPGLRVAAPAYVWSRECPGNDYTHSHLPPGCAREQYRLTAKRHEYGLGYQGRGNDWYRVGDDAFLLGCIKEICLNKGYVRNRFTR